MRSLKNIDFTLFPFVEDNSFKNYFKRKLIKESINGGDLLFFDLNKNKFIKNIELRGWGNDEYGVDLKDYFLIRKEKLKEVGVSEY